MDKARTKLTWIKNISHDKITFMEDSLKIILQKLNEIDTRLKKIEVEPLSSGKPATPNQKKQPDQSFLFTKAVEIAKKYDEITAVQMQKMLGVDLPQAEKIFDQLAAAGLGTCEWVER